VITIVLIAVLAVLAVTAVYFLAVVPSRWQLPYEKAVPLLERGAPGDLEQADQLFSQAITAGPRNQALGRIRFAQAYTRAMLGSYSDAATMLDALIAAEGRTEQTAFLELWLQARLDNHSRVTDLYEEHPGLLAGSPASRRMAAASHLHLATTSWRRREVNGAVHHFDKVREIGELIDKIPDRAADLQLAMGVQFVFDERAEDAREAFTRAQRRAAGRNEPTLEAELGLVVCDWNQPRNRSRDLGERLEKLDREARQRPGEDATTRSLRTGIALLLLITLLREWLARPAQSGPLSPADLEEFTRRVTAVREADPDLGDSYLIDGLVRYYFASDQTGRERALAALEKGTEQARAITLPEVRRLIGRERELKGDGQAIFRYLKLIDNLLADPDRSATERQRLTDLRARVIRSADASDIADSPLPEQRTPVEDQQRRIRNVRRQIELIVYAEFRDLPDDDPAKQAHRDLMAALDQAGKAYADGSRVLHSAEQDLMISVSQILLPEDSE
jgi:hypothetical protein